MRFELDHPASIDPGPDAVEHYQVSTAGLFLTSLDDARLQHCPDGRGKDCTALPVVLDPRQRRNWSVAAGSVYYVSAQSAVPDQVQRYRLDTGTVENLPWPRPGALSRALDVDPEGAFAIIARTDRIDVDLMWVSPEP